MSQRVALESGTHLHSSRPTISYADSNKRMKKIRAPDRAWGRVGTDWVNEWYFTDAGTPPYRYGSGSTRYIVGNVDTVIYSGPKTQILGSLPRTLISVA